MTDFDTDEVRKQHVKIEDNVYLRSNRCAKCGSYFPCDAIRACDEIDELRKMLSPKEALRTELIQEQQQKIDRLREALEGFFDYFDPRGGVSDVPLGPFERARAALGREENDAGTT